jgi:hypothetical protein
MAAKPPSRFSNSLLGYIVIWGGVLTAAWLIYAGFWFIVTRFIH